MAVGEVRLRFGLDWPPAAVLGVSVLVLVLAALLYLRVARQLGPRLGWLMVGLRLAGVVLLLLLVFRPILSFERDLKERPRVIFVVDTSGSMSIHDYSNQPSRLGRVVDRLREVVGEVEDDFEVRCFAFDASARRLEGPGELSGLKPEGKATHIARGVLTALVGQPRGDIAALFLLTDGIDNSDQDPAEVLSTAGVPITVVGVGTRLREEGSFRDIAVEDVEHPSRATVNNVVAVDAFIEGIGFADRVVEVRLEEEDGKLLASQRLVLDNKPGRQKVSLEFVPRRTGQFVYRLVVPPDDSERIRRNNQQTFTMTITNPKIRVLYIEGTLRTEYRELRRVLETDPNVEVLSLIRVAETTFNQQGNIRGITLTGFPRRREQVEFFDVFILGDIDRTFFHQGQLRLLRDMVREGKGLLMIGGYHTLGPGGYGGTELEEVLPVFLGDRSVGQEKEPFLPRLTEEGVIHPIFSGITDFFPLADRPARRMLPPLRGCVVTLGPQPGAQVLAVHPSRRDPRGNWLTVVAVRQFGKGRSMVFTGDTTWRWSLQLRALRRESPFVRFWGQTIRWLASRQIKERPTKPGLDAYTDKTYYRPGEKVVITAQVRGEEGRTTNRAETTATITLPSGGKTVVVTLPHRPGTTGEYSAEFTPPEPGNYRVLLSARNAETGSIYGRTQLRFQVGKPNLEFDRLDLNEDLLRRIARRTGGRYIRLYDLAGVLQSLRSARRRKVVQGQFAFCNDRHLPWYFAAFVFLISAEWVMRKRYQLS